MSKYVFVDASALSAFVDGCKKRLLAPPGTDFSLRRFLYGHNFHYCSRVFYYDAYPQKKPIESDDEFRASYNAKENFLANLNRQPYVHVRTGTLRHRKRNAGNLEQKGVDIQLALDVYQHAIRENISEAIIITNDLDFYPLFEALTQTKTTITLRYERGKTSDELIQVADAAVPLTLEECLGGFEKYELHREILGNKPQDFTCTRLSSHLFADGNIDMYTDGEWFYVHYDKSWATVKCKEPALGVDYFENGSLARLPSSDMSEILSTAAEAPLSTS